MSDTTAAGIQEWPAVRTPLKMEEAAKRIIRVTPKTLRRAMTAIQKKETGKGVTKNVQVLAVAELYLHAGKGAQILAGEIYDRIGYNEAKRESLKFPLEDEESLAKAAKPRKAKPKEMSDADLKKVFKENVQKANSTKSGPIPKSVLKPLFDELKNRGLAPIGSIRCEPFANALKFGSFSDFIQRAQAADHWPFILPRMQGKRPIDATTARKRDWKLGELHFITLEQWQSLLAAALVIEREISNNIQIAEALEKETAAGTPKVSGKKWGSMRMHNKD
jgi:hypothetical protein